MAADGFIDRDADQGYAQFIYQFRHPGTARAFVAGLRTTGVRCRSFAARVFGSLGRFTLRTTAAAPVDGHQALQIAEVQVSADTDTFDYDLLFVLDGTDVCGSISVGYDGAPVPSELAPATIAARLITRIQALR